MGTATFFPWAESHHDHLGKKCKDIHIEGNCPAVTVHCSLLEAWMQHEGQCHTCRKKILDLQLIQRFLVSVPVGLVNSPKQAEDQGD
jgi:hypothetical protein